MITNINSLIALFKNNKGLINSFGIATVAKFLSAITAFLTTLAIAQLMNEKEAGMFLLAASGLSAGVIFFRLGLDNVVLRKMSSSKSCEKTQSVLYTGICWIILTSTPFTLVVYLFSDNISTHILGKEEFHPILSQAIWALTPMSVFMLFAVAFQSTNRPLATTFFQNLGISFFFLVGLSVTQIFTANEVSALSASRIYTIGSILILALAIYMWNQQDGVRWSVPTLKDKDTWQACSNLWAASTMTICVQWSGILIAGAVVTSMEIAYLVTAQRTASLLNILLMIINLVVAPRFAKLWYQGNIRAMRKLSFWSTLIMIILAFPLFMIMLFQPDYIMTLFGPSYSRGAQLLVILALGQYINVATGSVGYLLNMSGNEVSFRKVTFIAGPITIILSLILVHYFGVTGIAVATTAGLITQNIGAAILVRIKLGFWPFIYYGTD